jgi:Membrane-bound lysozyme-inhibitor of c-type lysozyme
MVGMTSSRRAELIITQRGWIKGRDDCWKNENLRSCVLANYAIRIHELREDYFDARTQNKRGISRGPLVLRCKNFDALISFSTISSKPPVAYITWLNQYQRLMTLTPAALGSRYAAMYDDGETVLWIKGDEATLQLPKRDALDCRVEESG